MDCWPVPVFPQNIIQLHIQEIFCFDGKEKCLGLPLVENLHSPFENLLISLLHDAMVLNLSQPFRREKKENQLLMSRLEKLYSRWCKFLLGRKKYTTSVIFFCLSLFSCFYYVFFFKWNWECDQPKLIVTLIFKWWEIWWWMWFSCKTRLVKLPQILPLCIKVLII